MEATLRIIHFLAALALCCAPALAQSAGGTGQTFAKDGLSFEYADGWKLTDKSTPEAQHLILTREGSSVLIMVIAYRELIGLPEQLAAARQNITEPFIEDTVKKLESSGVRVEREQAQVKLGDEVAEGIRLRGMLNKGRTTAEVYSFLRKLRFVNLVYIRANKDSAQGDSAWDALRASLKLDTPTLKAGGQKFPDQELSGRAISLPTPGYPKLAKSSRASGTVVVNVVIDEQGNVIEAEVASGNQLFKAEALRAARLAKFSPTLIYNQPVRVSGVITYTFVPN